MVTGVFAPYIAGVALVLPVLVLAVDIVMFFSQVHDSDQSE
jgi:hypothetical protein